MAKQIQVMNTSFRDGFQSVYGARVLFKDYAPAIQACVEAGITLFESGGGAFFQSPIFYTNQNAFDVMDEFRALVGPEVKLQTLARGVNVVGLESQSSDIINLHAKMFKKHGVDRIRNFDALNDVNNLVYSGKCIKNNGLEHEITVTMMGLPPGLTGAHDPAFYEKTLRNILDAGIPFDSVAFKDASGTSTPMTVYSTIKRARALLGNDIHIRFHSHDTAGFCVDSYRAALDGGADGLDLSMKPVSGGTGQPDIITMWHALRGTNYDLGVDIDKILVAEEVFKDCMKDYFLPPEAASTDPMIVFSPMPGGALTANTQMMRDNNILDKYRDVIKAMKEVVAKGGFGTSVTPVSQFYFQQAFNNVMFGPWEKIADGYGKMVLGYFGKTPVAPDSEIVKIASEQLGLEPTTLTPIEINDNDPNKGIKAATQRLEDAGLDVTEENIFISAACKEKGIAFLKGEGKIAIRKKEDVAPAAPAVAAKPAASNNEGVFNVGLNGKNYVVELKDGKACVNGKTYDVTIGEGEATVATAAPATSGEEVDVKAPVPGAVLRINKKVGDSVEDGEDLLVLEAMKMELPVKSTASGVIKSIDVNVGDSVVTDQIIARVG